MADRKAEENVPLNNNRQEKRAAAAGRSGDTPVMDESYTAGDSLASQTVDQLNLLTRPGIQTRQRQNLAAQIGRLQGNRHLQRLVMAANEQAEAAPSPDAGLVQRQEAGAGETERAPSAALDLLFPDFYLELPPEIIRQTQRHIDARDYQAALDTLAAELDDMGLIDLSVLKDEQLVYDPARATGSTGGRTRTVWVEAGQGAWTRESIEVLFGPRAMLDANLLYSAIMHEWQHVRQVHDRSEPGGETEELLGELDAYCWQVEHAEATGTYDLYHMGFIRDSLQFVVWGRLTRPEIWDTFSDETQAQLTARYERAMEKIAQAPGYTGK